jgi:acyl-CoA dehydrogenase
MTEYTAPLQDMQFLLKDLMNLEQVSTLPGYEDATPDVVDAILEEAGKFAREVLSPLNRSGDIEGAQWSPEGVSMPSGWGDAYKKFIEGGWTSLSAPTNFGGQALPQLLSSLIEEIWNGANMAFTLSPMLTRGAQQVLEQRGSDYCKKTFLPKMVTGEWTGTMVLTEAHAGSDLGAMRTRAVRQSDGTYRLHGQKIFITYGEHDMADNIVHLVLARIEDAPAGSKGISLFVVPKFLVNDDGSLGALNDVHCVSIEHKMGIHASPTCVMAFGDNEGATGYLVGNEHEGLENMFVMMNSARYAVGLEGLGIAERAYQQALAYSKDRIQGTELGSKSGVRVPIIRHPDVRRMLMSMKSRIEAMRAISCSISVAMDKAARHPDKSVREENLSYVELMMPVAKGWFCESGVDIASLAIQVHGGVGFIEETGVAQLLRDARISTIYEGTTGIQALDLIGRKVARDNGHAMHTLMKQMLSVAADLNNSNSQDLQLLGVALSESIEYLSQCVHFMIETHNHEPKRTALGAVPFLELFSIVTGAWQLGASALVANEKLTLNADNSQFYATKIQSACFFTNHILSRANGLTKSICYGSDFLLRLEESQF